MKTQKSPSSKLEAKSTARRRLIAGPARRLVLLAAIAVGLLAGAAVSRAASGSWNGTADALWTNNANWSVSPAPGTGDTATFNGGGNGNTTIDLTGPVTVGSILFDSANAAAYTLGSGGAGNQSLTLDVNGSIAMSPTVTSNQVLNANLLLPALGFYNIVNNSATNTLTLAGTNASIASGSAVLTVDGTGTTVISGPIAFGTNGMVGLQKTNSGTLVLSGGGRFAATNVNSYLPGANYDPVDLRSGTTIISSGAYTNVGEFTVGGVITDGGPGNNVNLTMNGGSLAVSSWFSLGRGNGVGGVSSDLVLNNDASINAGNISCGYNVNVTNQPKGSVTLNNSSSINITGNGTVNFAESAGSDFTMTLNGTSQFIGLGTGQKNLGYSGTGTLTLNDSSAIHFGNGTCYVGHNYGTGAVTVASANAVFENAGELQIGGSDSSGFGRDANGTFTVDAGTVNLGALTIGRGNNNQNGVNGVLYINGGTVTSTNDVLLAFAGDTNTSGSIAMNGGTLNVGTTVTKWLRFGQWDFTSGEINITNGNLNLNTGTSIKFDQNNSAGPKTFNQYGGNVTFYSDFATTPGGGGNLDLMLSGVSTSTNTYNLNGGTLTVPQVYSSSTTGTRIFNFNGGTLKAVTPLSPFFDLRSGSAVVNVRDGGAVIDCNGNDIVINSPLVHSTIAGDAAIDGGLTKLGAGTLSFSNTPTYTGPTKVLGGGLNLNTAGGPIGTAASDFVVSNATLTVDASSGVAAILANNFTAAATLNLSQNPATNVIVAAGNLSLSNNAVISLAYGTLNGNPALPAIKAAGGLTAGNNITINVSAIGLRPGTFPLITVGSGMSASDFVLGTLPPGVVGSLSASGTTLSLAITSAPRQLTWQGENGTNWDTTTVNWTNNADGTPATYTQYSPEVGDGVVFNDTLTNDFVNPQPTNVNVTGEFTPFPVTVDSTLPFSLSGPGGITGVGSVIKNNTGTLTLLTSNSFSGGVVINGGTLIVTNDDALGANASVVTFNGGTLQVNGSTTNNSRALAVTSAGTIGVPTNTVVQFGGGVSGSGGLTKIDNGTLNLTGKNTYAGPTLVNAGTLNLGGTVTNTSATVGNTAGNAVMGISGTLITKNLFVGNVSGAYGAVYQNGGTVTASGGTGDNLSIGNWSGSFGYYNAVGGTMNLNGINIGGEQNPNVWPPAGSGDGIMEVRGATINNIGWIVLARGGGPNIGILNMYSGSLTYGGGGIGCNWELTANNDQTSIINILGGSVTSTNQGVNFRTAGDIGILNLDGGLLQGTSVTGPGTVNFNGGTLRPSAVFSNPFLSVNNAYVYNGGAVIDDAGKSLTIAQPLQGVTGSGLVSIPLLDGGSGYVAPPIVTVSDSSSYGSNATAVAQIDLASGTVTNILVTCPGSGWDPAYSGITLTFVGGGANVTPPTVDSYNGTYAANGTGGFTKLGSGTVTLTGVNTFTGPITNNAGTLVLNSASTYAGAAVNSGTLSMTPSSIFTGGIMVSNAATLTIIQTGTNTSSLSDLTLNGGAAGPGATLGLGLTGLNPTTPFVNCGVLTFNGTNTISLAGAVKAGNIPLVHYTSLALGSGATFTNLTLPQGVVGYVSNYVAGSTLFAIITSTGPGLVWSGTNTMTTASTNLWDIGVTTNWWLGSTPTAYQQPIVPGDTVTFNDLGSGTVVLKTNVGPSSLVISNNSVSYTFGGTGTITGPAGITKLGSGTATLNLTNNSYTGDTVVSNGTLAIGNATALPSAANLNVGPAGTLELNGFSTSINALSGSGTIQNSGTTSDVLTLGSAGGGGTWAGTIATGVGGSSFIQVGGDSIITGPNYLSSSAASQVNGGSMLITNGGSLTMSGGAEFWVMQNAGTASVTVDGGSLAVNSWLVIARNAAAANGTLTVNSGMVQKTGPNNIVVGSLGANGTLNVNGGQVLNSGELWLGEGPTAVATLNLNGGLIQAADIRENNNGGLPTTAGVAYFNGGTLQATGNSTNFLQYPVNFEVMGGGLVLDDNGFTLSIGGSTALLPGDGLGGGLLKKGSGTVYLDTPNSYTGVTVVSNGTLAGIGSVVGSVQVLSGGNLGAGDAATNGLFTIGGNLALQGNTTLRINETGGVKTNDQVVVAGSIAYGGTLTINNITSDGTSLTVGDTFQIFSGGGTGNFTSVTGPGATYSFDPTSGVLTVTSVVVGPGTFTNPTGITGFQLNGSNVVITGTNGEAGAAYYLLESTNVATPLSQWSPVATNVLGANGNYTFIGTNVVAPDGLQQFYILSNTNN